MKSTRNKILIRWFGNALFCLGLILFVPLGALSQGEMPVTPENAAAAKEKTTEKLPAQAKHDSLKAFLQTDSQVGFQQPNIQDPAMQNLPPIDKATQLEVATAASQLVIAKYKREIWSYQYEQKIYEWQYKTSIAVFYMVFVLVLCGMYFSWLQFRHSIQDVDKVIKKRTGSGIKHVETTKTAIVPADSSKEIATTGGDEPQPSVQHEETETFNIEASATGFKLSTSIFGIAILAFSLIFFYLYLHYIYPIR